MESYQMNLLSSDTTVKESHVIATQEDLLVLISSWKDAGRLTTKLKYFKTTFRYFPVLITVNKENLISVSEIVAYKNKVKIVESNDDFDLDGYGTIRDVIFDSHLSEDDIITAIRKRYTTKTLTSIGIKSRTPIIGDYSVNIGSLIEV